jgi:hypothetical protein
MKPTVLVLALVVSACTQNRGDLPAEDSPVSPRQVQTMYHLWQEMVRGSFPSALEPRHETPSTDFDRYRYPPTDLTLSGVGRS